MELKESKINGGWKVEIVEGERSVSRLWIVDRQMRVGRCPVLLGGIAGVGTDSQYRLRGLSRRVMNASLELMRREGYDASFLYGISDFYDKFGFVTCMPERRLYVNTRDAERAAKKLSLRASRPGDLASIARIYNRDNARRTASVVRDRKWGGFTMGSNFGVPVKASVVVDAQQRVCGYVAYDAVEERCRAAEVGGEGEAVFSTILHFLARRAVALRRRELSLSMPVDHPFAHYCRSFGCRDSTHFSRNAGPMGCIVNLPSFIGKIAPELEERWGAADRGLALELKTDIGRCALGWKRGKLAVSEKLEGALVARLKQDALMQLAMGYLTAGDLRNAAKLRAGRETVALLERLFPLQTAHMWWSDRF